MAVAFVRHRLDCGARTARIQYIERKRAHSFARNGHGFDLRRSDRQFDGLAFLCFAVGLSIVGALLPGDPFSHEVGEGGLCEAKVG